ncbi:ROK family transcriptional regulator [Armatimonas sp.]|uniref:ROK family transcriptional regulator n=1 Tax=Armatimonas sp. TaxID=1872638 RepID=UPI00286C7BE5|nr:ROK family transcriptional regulator [Armatimonas sp.]
MPSKGKIQPGLLGRINEWRVLRTIQRNGSLSRAELARATSITAPTASKAVEALLRDGWLIEEDDADVRRGRPAKKLRVPSKGAQVLGVVIDQPQCRLVTAGLDGVLRDETRFTTPESYEALLHTALTWAQERRAQPKMRTYGLCVAMPGLIDYTEQRGLLSPNVHITDGHTPALDLQKALGVPCVLIHEIHSLSLAERHRGSAQGLDDFALMDLSTGVGFTAVLRGQPFTGHRGLAGELGHITVNSGPEARLCGCGNRGCLETEVSDLSLQTAMGAASLDEAIARYNAGETEVIQAHLDYLAIGIAAAIHVFNPPHLFLNSRFLQECPALLPALQSQLAIRTLKPALDDCTIRLAQGNKSEGVIAGIIEHLTNALLPTSLQELHLLDPALAP